MNGRRWTDAEQEALIRAFLTDTSIRKFAAEIGRSPGSCHQKAHKLGINMPRGSPAWRGRISRRNKGHRRSPATEFKKGNVPWTKGKKGIHQSPATEFKSGCLRGQAARNWKAVGTVVVWRDKTGRRRHWVKVRDVGPPQYRWVPLARFLYERAHGPLPAGTFVVHRDGDTMNDDLANLQLMTRQQLIAWQESVRPGSKEKRRRRSSRATKRRWQEYRALKSFRQQRKVI